MPSTVSSATPTLDGRTSLGNPILRKIPWLHVLTAVGLLLVLLGLLGYAETVWLHEALPQDRVSRVSLAAFPGDRSGAPPEAALAPEWQARLTADATRADVLQAIGAQVGQELPASHESVAAPELTKRMRVTAQCIQTASADGRAVRGLLLVATVRGSDGPEVEAIARAWSKQMVKVGTAEHPGLVVVPVEALSVPYEACRS
jgi:hypothetical protein